MAHVYVFFVTASSCQRVLMWTNEPCAPAVREFAFMDKLSTELQEEVQLPRVTL
jgi:hypothetical protein